MYLSTRYIGVIEKLVEFLVRSSLIPNSDTPGVFLLSLKLLQTAVRFFTVESLLVQDILELLITLILNKNILLEFLAKGKRRLHEPR